MASPFQARYRGRCAECGEAIAPGQQVQYDVDEQLVHVDCDADAPTPEPAADVCQKCWLTRPCGCDDQERAR